jgi:general secretion pathway protein E
MCYTMGMANLDPATANGEELLAAIQAYSVEAGASDIHTSPERDGVRFEVRLDGQLRPLRTVTKEDYEAFVRQVKFAAKLKLNVQNVPQDGEYSFAHVRADGSGPSRRVNVRVATLPTRFGETITLRFLDPARGIQPLTTLGFPADFEAELQEIAKLPYGLVLVTGPTGSGKTTTLYALLQSLIGTARNIITLEDPVEYEIPGIVQSEIDPDHGFTFASGLRSVLRHDPNVILVGEIRDLETAQTAIDAALTGHLVLSTLHTNSAIEAIPRLLSMGVSPYTFAPALRAVLAQRLVRTIKPELRGTAYDPSDPASYEGRMCVPELLRVTPALRDLILTQEREDQLEAQARKDGYLTMKEWGNALVEQGLTSKEEVARVTG